MLTFTQRLGVTLSLFVLNKILLVWLFRVTTFPMNLVVFGVFAFNFFCLIQTTERLVQMTKRRKF